MRCSTKRRGSTELESEAAIAETCEPPSERRFCSHALTPSRPHALTPSHPHALTPSRLMSEFELIAKYFTRKAKRRDVLLGVGDDAAVLKVPNDRRLIAAVDTIVEGVHFPVGTDAEAIGYRALAVNLSDIAAMGAEPAWATLSLSLPREDSNWLAQFSSGLYRLADQYNVDLVGGDTVRGQLAATISILGLVETDRCLTRGGAKPGDTIFVSGVPGEAAAGLALMQKKA